ncbi:hypothetical protein ACH3XW_37330 [Acanthocheilonema viteae]
MTFVTFVIAVAAIGAFYFYSTKPACREAVNNWSVLACDALQEKVIQPSVKRKKEVSAKALPSGSTATSATTGSPLATGTSDDEKPGGMITALGSSTLNREESQPSALRPETAETDTAREKKLTGEKKKKKKKSKNKKSKKKKSSKRSKKSEEIIPDEP